MEAHTIPVQLRRRAASLAAIAFAAMAALPALAAADVAVELDRADVAELAGNDTGAIDPGERFAVTPWVHSSELGALTGVTGTLSAPGEVALDAAQAAFPDLLFGQSTASLTPFAGQVAETAACGAPLRLQLDLATSGGTASLPVVVPTGAEGPTVAGDSADVPRAIPDPGTTSSGLTVAGDGLVKSVRVRIGRLDHTYDRDLRISLVAPDGTSVLLADRVGGSGDGFVDTVFSADAGTPITAGTAPFTGTYRPQGDLTALAGTPVAGTWQLRVADLSGGDRGVLRAWGADTAPAVCTPVRETEPPGFARRSERAQGQWPQPPGWERHELERHSGNPR